MRKVRKQFFAYCRKRISAVEEQRDDVVERNSRLQNDLQTAKESFERRLTAAENEYRAKADRFETSRGEEMERIRCKYEKILRLFEEKLRRLQSLQSQQNEKLIKDQVALLNEQTRRQVEAEFEKKFSQ